jgi:hypothetical protein
MAKVKHPRMNARAAKMVCKSPNKKSESEGYCRGMVLKLRSTAEGENADLTAQEGCCCLN